MIHSRREIIPLKQPLRLTMKLPGSKSVTQRALLCAAFAQGTSRLFGALFSDDTSAMIRCLRQVGVGIHQRKDFLEVHGTGGKFKSGVRTLNAGGSGLAARFLMTLMLLREGKTIITGDESLKKRPMKNLVEALRQLGAKIHYTGKKGFLPIRIIPTKLKPSQSVDLNAEKSSQYLSALLLMTPLLDQPIKIQVKGDMVSLPYIDTTLAVMKGFGIRVKNDSYRVFGIRPQYYKSQDYQIEGDATAANYFSALQFLHGGNVTFENLNLKRSIQGDANFLDQLELLKRGRSRTINMNSMPDAALTLAVCALFAKGNTKISGLSTLRWKESDRLLALKNELNKIGVQVSIGKDWIEVHGVRKSLLNSLKMSTKNLHVYGDHRLAMCFAVLGTKIPGMVVEDPICVNKTYPDFWKDFERVYNVRFQRGSKNLLLIGMRGAGKTTLGKKLAERLGYTFVDLDAKIEKAKKMKISKMVELHGWPYFRNVEQKICSNFGLDLNGKFSKSSLVIAAGGGVVLSPKKMKSLQQNATTIFLYADPSVLLNRLEAAPGDRPAITSKPLQAEIHDLWRERRHLYLKYADVVWENTSRVSLKSILLDV